MAYAILVHRKHHTWADLGLAAAHNSRVRPSLNIDTGRSRHNVQLHGEPDLVRAAKAAIEAAGIPKLRKNGVVAVELLMSASPDYFRPDRPATAGTWRQDRLDAWVIATMTHLHKAYGSNLLAATLHLDETTPHIHAIVVPIDRQPRKKGAPVRLNAARWFDGGKKLSARQDEYHAAVAYLGLERGARGSTASHVELKEWYRTMGALRDAAAADRQAAADARDDAEVERLLAERWERGRAAALAAEEKARAQAEADARTAAADRAAASEALQQADTKAQRVAREWEEVEASRRAADSLLAVAQQQVRAASDDRSSAVAERRQAENDRLDAEGERAAAELLRQQMEIDQQAALQARAEAARMSAAAAEEKFRADTYAQAIGIGVSAWAEGIIIRADKVDGRRRLVWAEGASADQRRRIMDAIAPAYDAVWKMIRRLGGRLAEMAERAKETAAGIVRRAEAEVKARRLAIERREREMAQREAAVQAEATVAAHAHEDLQQGLRRVRALERGLPGGLAPAMAERMREAEELAVQAGARITMVRQRTVGVAER